MEFAFAKMGGLILEMNNVLSTNAIELGEIFCIVSG